MSRGNPVEFVRRLRLQSDAMQRVGNRVKLEAFEIEAAHAEVGEEDDTPVALNLGNPGENVHWRFNNIHLSFDGFPAAGTLLTIDSGAVNYAMPILAAGPHDLDFSQVRWATAAGVIITLAAAGVGVTGYLAVLGARIERDIYS